MLGDSSEKETQTSTQQTFTITASYAITLKSCLQHGRPPYIYCVTHSYHACTFLLFGYQGPLHAKPPFHCQPTLL